MAGVSWARFVVLVDDLAGFRPRGVVGQHGFSVAISVDGWDGFVLFDTGQDAGVVLGNASRLGVGLERVRVVVLSHGHYDHSGGLVGVLRSIGGRVPVVSHPFAYRPALVVRGGVLEDIGMPFGPRDVEAAGGIRVGVRSALGVAPGVYFLGEVERVYPELAPGLPGSYTIGDDGVLVEHPLLDDSGVAVVVEGLGAIVVSGCGHSGIVNMALAAEKATGERVYAVMGGFHMAGYGRAEVERVIRELRKIGVEEVYPGHCTGLRAEYALLEAFRGRRLAAGVEVVFSSPGKR